MIDYQDVNMLRAIGLNVVVIETKKDLENYFDQIIPFNAIVDAEIYGDLSGPKAFWPEVVVDYWVWSEGSSEVYTWYDAIPEEGLYVYDDLTGTNLSACIRFF